MLANRVYRLHHVMQCFIMVSILYSEKDNWFVLATEKVVFQNKDTCQSYSYD